MSGAESEDRTGEALDEFEPLTAGHLFFLLHHVVRQRETALGLELVQMGLTLNQWQILATLRRLDRATMGEVAAFCATDRTTLTRTVDRMVEDALVQRDRDLADRRQVQLILTEKGRAVYERALLDVTRFNDRITGVLRAEEVEWLRPMIRRVLVHVLDDKAWVDDLMAFRRMKGVGPATSAEPAIEGLQARRSTTMKSRIQPGRRG